MAFIHCSGFECDDGVDILKNTKYVIVSPRQKWGGAIVLHVLCKQLSNLGYNSSILYVDCFNYRQGHKLKFWIKYLLFTFIDIFKEFCVLLFGEKNLIKNKSFIGYVNLTVKGCKRRIWPFVGNKTIVVYPEVIYGNFTHAEKVVRWLLYYNDYECKDDYGEKDLFICYRDVFNDKKLNPSGLSVKCPYFNLDLYRRYNYKKRSGRCYIIRKGKDRKELPIKFDGPIIDDLPEEDKVAALNKYKYCIIYDLQTSYKGIAALCGCISIVIPEKGKSPADYRRESPCNGVAFGVSISEIKHAKNTQHLVKTAYENTNQRCEEDVRKFISICEDYFKEK